MNTLRVPRLLKHTTLLLAAFGSSLWLSGCGGDSNKTATSSSSSSVLSSHSFSSTPIAPALDGTWPNVKVSASGTKTLKFDWTPAPNAAYYKLLKKADAASAYAQVGDNFTANTISDSVSVHLTDWLNASYKVQACTAADACDTNSTEVAISSAMLNAITYVKASNTEANDWFGWSIAIAGDGKTLAVGAPAEGSKAMGANGDDHNNESPTSGAVYVFAKVNGNWLQEAYLKASNTEQPGDGITSPIKNPNARFGYQVALSTDGNTLAVSAINEDSRSVGVNCDPNYLTSSSSASNSAGYVTHNVNLDIGAVYVFKRTNVQWAQTAYIKPLLAERNLAFGYNLALSGDGSTLAVGSPVESGYYAGVTNKEGNASSNSLSSSSSSEAFVCINFSSSSSSSTSSSLSSSATSSSSLSSSSSSSLSSTSASSSSIPGGPNSGAVYIYRLNDTGWSEEAYVKASDAGQDDLFGTSLSLSQDGNLMAVGAPGEDSKTTNADNDIIVLNGTIYAYNNGGVYLFTRSAKTWSESAKLKPKMIQLDQAFGASLALSADGSTLAVGSTGDWTATGGIDVTTVYDPTNASFYSSGAAYIFTKTEGAWVQQAYIKPNVVKPLGQFGSAVSLSANGSVLAVGAWIESSQATGINGDQIDAASPNSGAAYMFTRNNGVWAQKSYIKAPNSNARDRFGRTLKLDDSGETLAVGAYREASKATGINGDRSDNSAPNAGAAYLY